MSSASSTDPTAGRPRGVALLGSTGSIGRQALEVLGVDPSFRVVALAAGRNATLLAEQAARYRPTIVALADAVAVRGISGSLPPGISIAAGDDALVDLVTRDDVDFVVVGTGGVVSLRPVLAALAAGKIVATANK